jgi:Ni,Fe-hydrogenase III large subunit
LTSIDGGQVLVLLLSPEEGQAELIRVPVTDHSYPSLTASLPQAHWFERALNDLFGIRPVGHPRLKSSFVEQAFTGSPLRKTANGSDTEARDFQFMRVSGDGVYELPVGPIHAGIIEPAHFRLSCLGEIIQNLEIRLGYVHRGVEKRMTEVPWRAARFVAESAASDTAAANALAYAIAVESMFDLEIPARAQHLRTLALEVERLAMHVFDLGGMAVDLGYLGISASLSRLRGTVLRLADLLSGSRFLRGFICPGGVTVDPKERLEEFGKTVKQLHKEVDVVLTMFMDNALVNERLSGTGVVSTGLARDFGLVGVAARASGIPYDTRMSYDQGLFPTRTPCVVTATGGDALARTQVRVDEVHSSFAILESAIVSIEGGPVKADIPEQLPAETVGVGIVEAFRGELLHMAITDQKGALTRYAIKDPSFVNWTGMAIAARNNLIADFPICNKSFALSYSGHDL